MSRRSRGGFGRAVLMVPIALALGGCFLVSWLPGRRDSTPAVPGPALYVEECQACHPAPAGYAQSVHSAKGIHCGQCHRAGGHPDYTQPVRDATCGGCHLPQYEQTLASKHFEARALRVLEDDRAARGILRRERFTTATAAGGRFVGDSSSGELGGRLCAACHYDEHRLGLGAVRQPEFCVGCHAGRETHFPIATPGLANRCMQCHVRAGATEHGQVLNTHRFTRPGAGS
jgi:Cytochrome c7 and related cytochrome c